MNENELQKIWNVPSELSYRDRVEELQELLLKGELINNDVEIEVNNKGKDILYPSTSRYNHYFSSGLYVREMLIGGGCFGFTGIHKLANPLFVMKGVMWCTTKDGVQELAAPTFVLTEPGTKRICWFPEDSIVVTVHPNPDGITDLNEMEKIIACTGWDEYSGDEEAYDWQLFEHKDYHKKIGNEINK
jgi:hypothetical protein